MRTEPASNASGRLRRAAAALSLVALVAILAWMAVRRPGPAPETRLPEVERSSVIRENGLLVLKGSSHPFTGKRFENHSNGSRKLEISVKAGRLEGISRGWHASGQLESEEFFRADHSDGLRTRWFANGACRSTATIRDGRLEGPFTEWYDTGTKAVVMMMKDGKAEGLVEAWHPSGAPKSRTTMNAGQIVSREFFEDPSTAQAKAE